MCPVCPGSLAKRLAPSLFFRRTGQRCLAADFGSRPRGCHRRGRPGRGHHFASLPTGMPRSLMARNKRHFLVRLAHEHGGAYPRIAGLGAAVERKIKLIQESRQMPGPERQLAQSRFPHHPPTPEPRAATACDRHIATCVILKPSGARLRTFAMARSSLACNFVRCAAAAALVGKDLLARRRVWPLRTYRSNEPSAPVCRRT